MTVSSTTNRIQYAGNSLTTVFAFTFKVFATTDVDVYFSDGVTETLLTVDVDYTITINEDQNASPGGTVTMLVAPANSTILVILRSLPFDQETDLANGGAFYAETVENAFDKLTMQIQQVKEEVDRSLKFGVTSLQDPDAFVALIESGAGSAAAAAASASSASTSATNAAISAAAAANSADAANGTLSSINSAQANFNSTIESITPTYNVFSGTGAQTAFTLSQTPTTEDAIDVYVNGVYQQKSAYSLSGSTLTFTSAPASGTNNIEVKIAPLVAYLVAGAIDYGLIV